MLLLDTMKLCSEKIFPTFCEILVLVEMVIVIRKLEIKHQSFEKRKSSPGWFKFLVSNLKLKTEFL